jgi:methionyl aminopeptidase
MLQEAIELRSPAEVAAIGAACAVVHEVLEEVRRMLSPGLTTGAIDRLCLARLEERGARPAFRGYHGFPASICVSVNDEVVHGIPSDERALREGDLVSLDFGAVLDGWFGDAAITAPVGRASPEALHLAETTREALLRGVAAASPGGRLGDVGFAIQRHVESRGYSVVRDFVGHGIGRRLHEPPQIPNYGAPGTGIRLRPGMVLAIEPMVSAGRPEVDLREDGWTAVTADGSLAAHFEHTVAVTEAGPVILGVGTAPGAAPKIEG